MNRKPLAYIVYASDNVATALTELATGEVRLIGGDNAAVTCIEAVPRGHKLALSDIPAGAAIQKYGARIGTATQDIPRGSHVHLHNMKSDFDDRASTLDVETAVPTDVKYEL